LRDINNTVKNVSHRTGGSHSGLAPIPNAGSSISKSINSHYSAVKPQKPQPSISFQDQASFRT